MNEVRCRRAVVWLGLFLAFGACDDDPPETVSLPCDIRERLCQRAVFDETARLRNQQDAKLPPIRVITRDQYAEETRQMVSNSTVSRGGEILQGVLRLLRFLPPNASVGQAAADSSIEGVAAYYHKRERAVTIIDDAASNPSSGVFTLSHEFVHALQDQREDLTALDAQAKNADDALAVDCLVEGEAVVISDVLLAELRDSGAANLNFPLYFDRMLAAFLGEIEKSTAPLTHALMTLAYPVGGRPLAAAYVGRGMPGILAYYEDRPLTMVGWVEGDPMLPTALRCGTAPAPPGYKLYGVDRLGGAGLISLHTRLGKTGLDAFAESRPWINDQFAIFATPEGTPVASAFAWRIGLRSVEAATNLETALRAAAFPQVDVTRGDNEVLIVGATDAALLASWTDRHSCTIAKSRTQEPTERLPLTGPFDDYVHQPRYRR